MRRIAGKHLLTIVRDGHAFFIVFDISSRDSMLDYLLDLAEDPAVPLGWEDIFAAIDAVGAATGGTAQRKMSSRI